MSDKYFIEPDINFINEVKKLGGDSLKKCFQCATCSVACPIAPDNKPFPRKEMIAASWGLKDRLISNADIWLCHQCGDCSTLCPRGAKPGDVLGAIRSYAISEYATPKSFAKMVNDPGKLPLLLIIPAIIFIVIGMITGQFSFSPGAGEIVQAKIFTPLLVQIIFPILTLIVIASFGMGLKRFLNDIHQNAINSGLTDKRLDIGGVISGLFKILPTILKHDKFSECSENKDRMTAHLLVFYSFIGLLIVTAIFFIVLDFFHIPGPYSQSNPVKWLANISGVALIMGSIMMIKNRLGKTDQTTSYKDWYLLYLVFGLGFTGMLTEIARLIGLSGTCYISYFIHLILVFNLIVFLPYSKMAHFVYRTLAMAHAEYIKR
ncbi:MAG: quinone-interacting membrane-bound oxidoreductase complex subunit QmoC [Deltaproteobacteria bacterium]|nr:quinone-interacting membrane-bound oxidoreductase complex subunit QmoC [Deltaproteobacteria bacterium]